MYLNAHMVYKLMYLNAHMVYKLICLLHLWRCTGCKRLQEVQYYRILEIFLKTSCRRTTQFSLKQIVDESTSLPTDPTEIKMQRIRFIKIFGDMLNWIERFIWTGPNYHVAKLNWTGPNCNVLKINSIWPSLIKVKNIPF